MKIGIVLLNYNSSFDSRKCIASLQKQESVETEIIVVDNCSPQAGEQETIRTLCREQNCTFIQATENRGYNTGNNIGLRYAASKRYKYVLIANPDMEFPQTDYLQRLVAKMEEDEDVVVCASDIVSPEGVHQNPMQRDGDWHGSFGWLTDLFKRSKGDDTLGDWIDRPNESRYCAKVSGCCLMVRLDFMQQIGFFDENVFLYCEEAILSRQVERAGRKMYYIAEARAIHAHVKSEKGDPVSRFKAWRDSRIYFIKHNSGDSWMGRQISIISMKIYTWVLIFTKTIRK